MADYFIRVVVTAFLLLCQPLVFAKHNKDAIYYDAGFTEEDHYYPITQASMARLEMELFAKLTDFFIQLEKKPNPQGISYYLQNLNGTSLLNVKINNKWGVLVNLDKSAIPDYRGTFDDISSNDWDVREKIDQFAVSKGKSLGTVSFVYDGYEAVHYDPFVSVGKDETYYPGTEEPMTVIEQKLLTAVINHLDQLNTTKNVQPHYLTNLNKTTLLSIKINEQGDVLVNFDKALLEDYYDGKHGEYSDNNGQYRELIIEKSIKSSNKLDHVGMVLFTYNSYDIIHYAATPDVEQ